jgi:OOP family OmpA-OmpF porin
MKANIHKFLMKVLLVNAFIISSFQLSAQDIVWANKLLELTDRFQFENNMADLVLGPPRIYPSGNFEEPHDPYYEGYIVHYQNTNKKNVFTVAFPKAVNAKQIIIGGIFNIGTISEISVILKDNKQKVVYKLDKPTSKVKFKSFATFIPYNTIYGVKVTLNHSNINGWNVIKGVGLSNDDKLYEIAPALIDTSHNHKKEVIGENVNSNDCFEFNPKIAPDGKTLYFVKECQGQGEGDQDIWYSERDSAGQWKDAKNIGVPLNNKGHNFVASISPDGQTLVIGNKYKGDGSDGGDGVSISRKDEDGNWRMPRTLEIPKYENLNEHANFYMSNDNSVLLMAIQDKNSIGDQDLYASIFNKSLKSWSEPINLGNTINTVFQEDYPYLANDGVTLFFSSKGQIGYGGMDIYMSKRLDDSWTKWSTPQNLGPFVNTKADDKGFTIASEGDHAYFNSAPFNSDLHHMDIFRVDLPKMLHQIPRILVSGTCYNAKDKKGLRAMISIKDDNGSTVSFCVSNPKSGKYVMSVPFGKVYDIMGEVIEYFKITEKLALTDITMGIESKKNFEFKAFMDTGTVYKMQDILFESNSATLMDESYHELDKVSDLMKQQSKSIFEIIGHTDNVGAATSNKILSEERVKSVITYLISNGIKSFRLKSKGMGEIEPVADNESVEGRALNRRVEFKVLEKDFNTKLKPKASKYLSTTAKTKATHSKLKKKK